MANNTLRITLIKSKFGRLPKHKECLKGLGLSRISQTVEIANTPQNIGMINKISYMLKVE